MRVYLPAVVDASLVTGSAVAATPAGTVVVRAAGLRVQGVTVTAGGQVPPAGELAVFCRPVVTAPAVVRRDGTVLADGWLPDFVRLGELERHLGDGVIEAAVDAALTEGRLRPRQRRRIMSSGGPDRGWLPDGSRMTWLNAPSGRKARLPVRAAEHNVIMPAADGTEEASQTCTVITTLLDHRAAPALRRNMAAIGKHGQARSANSKCPRFQGNPEGLTFCRCECAGLV